MESGEAQAKTGTPFWDDATVGYMLRTASFNRSSSGDPSAGIATFRGPAGAYLCRVEGYGGPLLRREEG